MQDNKNKQDKEVEQVSTGQQQKQNGSSQNQNQSHPIQEFPGETPPSNTDNDKDGSKAIPEIDEEHVHEINPVVSGTDPDAYYVPAGVQSTNTTG